MPSRYDPRGAPPLNRSTRSWTDHDGIHYTVNSFSSPGISLGAMTGNSGAPSARNFPTFDAPRPSARASMFGNAFSILEDMIAIQQQQRAAFENGATHDSRTTRKQDFRPDVDSESDGEYDDGGPYGDSRKRSVFSRIKDRVLDTKRIPRKKDGPLSGREESPAPSPRSRRRESSYRTETREPAGLEQRHRPAPVHIVVEHEDEDSDDEYSDARSRRSPTVEHSNFDALEDAVEAERRAVRSCKRRLEQASRQSNVTSSSFQQVIDEMKIHETAVADATNRLNKARSQRKATRAPLAQAQPRAQTRPRPQAYQSRPSRQRQSVPTFEGHFFPPFAAFGFEPPSAHRDPIFDAYEQLDSFNQFPRPQSFAAFEHLFGNVPGDDSHFHVFDMPGTHSRDGQPKRTRHSRGPPPPHHHSHQFPASTPPPTPPSPQAPPSLLRPAEAQRLFKAYDDRWKSILPTEPAFPYPARGLQASALSARDSIWAPDVRSDVSTWNEETVMQANAQAFYLGVVGLKPQYAETTGKGQIECGFDRGSASPEQIKQLIDLLKKEKPRWHSDRLGRRNGGVMGGLPNESLQKDVRARAVFHAVCELMDRAQE